MDILALCLETITNDIKHRDPALNHIPLLPAYFDPSRIRCLQTRTPIARFATTSEITDKTEGIPMNGWKCLTFSCGNLWSVPSNLPRSRFICSPTCCLTEPSGLWITLASLFSCSHPLSRRPDLFRWKRSSARARSTFLSQSTATFRARIGWMNGSGTMKNSSRCWPLSHSLNHHSPISSTNASRILHCFNSRTFS